MTNLPQSLWDFALAFYAEPQIAETCLLLQDKHNANVCLIIGFHWLDVQGRHLSTTDLMALTGHTYKWTHDIIAPLRQLRRTLKTPFENYPQDALQEQLRNSIKEAELLAEKKLLIEIENWLATISFCHFTQESNLTNYLITLGMEKSFINLIQKKLTSR